MFSRSAIWRETRPFVAILLAYAIAAQVLIAGAVGGQIAAGPGAVSIPICYGLGSPAGGEDEPGQRPVRDVPCTLCSAALCAPAIVAGSADEFLRLQAISPPAMRVLRALLSVHETKSRFSRGPPAIA